MAFVASYNPQDMNFEAAWLGNLAKDLRLPAVEQ